MQAEQIEFGLRCRHASGFEGNIRAKTEYDDGSYTVTLRNELAGDPGAPHLEETVFNLDEVEPVET